MDAQQIDKRVAHMLANPSGMPIEPHQAYSARCRPRAQRTILPKSGDRVWYRHWPHAELTEAQVQRVVLEDAPHEDYNVWRFVLDGERRPVVVGGKRVMVMVDDPWPDVYLRTDFGLIVTRESRIEGSPGWLPKREDG